jgi:hypothetical protein
MINDQTGTLTSPQVQPYLLFVLTAIDLTQQTFVSGQLVTVALMPAGVQFVIFTATGSGPATANWRGWLPMEVGEYLEVEAGISISASFKLSSGGHNRTWLPSSCLQLSSPVRHQPGMSNLIR